MAKKTTALAGIFDDELETRTLPKVETQPASIPIKAGKGVSGESTTRRNSHPGKKPVLIHIPEDMHRTLRQLSVEEGGEPLTVITERLLRQYLVQRGHTRFAP
ncbi:hypothetical protein [Brytella acorum]|uniref:hypothetical protein n=1 Tax=Brytella acorum TaxID=2959299 RepID=UPI0025AE19BC|nr:hypothetical protein [Brytella acorum]MDF3626200.1 hypothetical protein [Brytella acorum]